MFKPYILVLGKSIEVIMLTFQTFHEFLPGVTTTEPRPRHLPGMGPQRSHPPVCLTGRHLSDGEDTVFVTLILN